MRDTFLHLTWSKRKDFQDFGINLLKNNCTSVLAQKRKWDNHKLSAEHPPGMIVSCLCNRHHILSTVKRFLLPCAVFLRMQLSCKQNICLNSNFKASIFFQEVYHIDSVGSTPTRNRWFLLDNTYWKHLLNWDTTMLNS